MDGSAYAVGDFVRHVTGGPALLVKCVNSAGTPDEKLFVEYVSDDGALQRYSLEPQFVTRASASERRSGPVVIKESDALRQFRQVRAEIAELEYKRKAGEVVAAEVNGITLFHLQSEVVKLRISANEFFQRADDLCKTIDRLAALFGLEPASNDGDSPDTDARP